jgi:hypothetical protein
MGFVKVFAAVLLAVDAIRQILKKTYGVNKVNSVLM